MARRAWIVELEAYHESCATNHAPRFTIHVFVAIQDQGPIDRRPLGMYCILAVRRLGWELGWGEEGEGWRWQGVRFSSFL